MHYLSVSNPFHTLVIKLCETVGHCSVILLRYVFFKPPLSENHCFVCLRILSHQFLLFVVRNSPQQVTGSSLRFVRMSSETSDLLNNVVVAVKSKGRNSSMTPTGIIVWFSQMV